MKRIFLSASLFMLIDCSKNKIEPKILENETSSIQLQKINSSELKKYQSVKKMLEDAHDFNVEEGTLKFINNDESNLHIQVSKPFVKGDWEEIIKETVKRDIVYVVFQVFAQTSINKITITSVPIDFEDKTKYYNSYKQTLTVTRKKADQIMKEEFGSTDYSILFSNLNSIQVPSEHFSQLKFKNLELVYSKLSK